MKVESAAQETVELAGGSVATETTVAMSALFADVVPVHAVLVVVLSGLSRLV